MEKISYLGAMNRVKRAVASRKKDLKWTDILAGMELTKPPLRFTQAGKGGLAAPINTQFAAFETRITPTEARKAKRVRNLTETVWDKMPAKYKA